MTADLILLSPRTTELRTGSWKELMLLLVRNPLHLLSRPLLLLLSAMFLLQLSQLTYYVDEPLTPTLTHSSTHMTQPTVTSSSTETEPTLPPLPIPVTLSTMFPPVLTVPVSTLSSIHLMLLSKTPKLMFGVPASALGYHAIVKCEAQIEVDPQFLPSQSHCCSPRCCSSSFWSSCR